MKRLCLTVLVALVAALACRPVSAMNKAELIDAIASNSGLSKADAGRALDALVGNTANTLRKGDKVSLIGFGTFSVSRRAARSLSRQRDITRRERACLWLAAFAPEWIHDIFCTTDELGLAEAMFETPLEDGTLLGDRALAVIEIFTDFTTRNLVAREVVDIDEFGVFFVEEKPRRPNTVVFEAKRAFVARIGRNPQTGEEIPIPAKKVAKFKAGADLSKKVN